MTTLRKWTAWCAVVIGASACCLAVVGQESESEQEQAFLELATARAKVDYVMRASRKLMDENQSGWRITYDSTYQHMQEAQQVLAQAEHQERQKPGDQQNQAFLNECQRMRNDMQQTWNQFEMNTRRPLDRKYYEARIMYGDVNAVLRYVQQLENEWKTRDFDPSLLTPLYVDMNTRARKAKALAEEAHQALDKEAKRWEAEAKAAEAYLATHTQ